MKTHLLQRAYLVLAGAVALAIGATLLVDPHALYATNQIALADDASTLSEVRAPGAFLVAAGVAILFGALRSAWTAASTRVSAALYLAYAAGRAIGWALDGEPASGLVAAMAIELVLGAAAAAFVAASPSRTAASPA